MVEDEAAATRRLHAEIYLTRITDDERARLRSSARRINEHGFPSPSHEDGGLGDDPMAVVRDSGARID